MGILVTCASALDQDDDISSNSFQDLFVAREDDNMCETKGKCAQRGGYCQPKTWNCNGKFGKWKGCDGKNGCSCCKEEYYYLSANVIDSTESFNSTTGPENLFMGGDTFWIPASNNGTVTFDFWGKTKFKQIKIMNIGDDVHDVSSFVVESSNNLKKWKKIAEISPIPGNGDGQYFKIRGKGQYLKVTITSVITEAPAMVRYMAFWGKYKM